MFRLYFKASASTTANELTVQWEELRLLADLTLCLVVGISQCGKNLLKF